jgi:dihydrofolate reductase
MNNNKDQKVFFSTGISLNGYMAGPNRSPENQMGDGGGPKLHSWIFKQKTFRDQLGIPGGGETGPDDDLIKMIFSRAGASIMGHDMFLEGEKSWPENAPFHHPVFVLTHEKREQWVRPGGTTFFFVNDGIESALEQARKAAGDKDVQINGGGNTLMQYLNGGFVDDFIIHISPVFLGSGGLPLFENVQTGIKIKIRETIASQDATHIIYDVIK